MSSALVSSSCPSMNQLTRSQKRKVKAQRQRLRAIQAARGQLPSVDHSASSKRESLGGPQESKACSTTLALTQSTHDLLNSCRQAENEPDEPEETVPTLAEEQADEGASEPVADAEWDFCREAEASSAMDDTQGAAEPGTDGEWELV